MAWSEDHAVVDDEESSEFDEAVRAMGARRRRALAYGIAAAAASAIFALVWPELGRDVRAYTRGETTIDGEPRYEPAHPMGSYATGQIDFDRVHRQLIPAWTVGLGIASTASTPYWGERADERFQELAFELEPDPNLSDLMASTHQILRHGTLDQVQRIDYSLWAYNRYLDDAGVPWRLEASLSSRGVRPVLHTRNYQILADARTGDDLRLRLLRRADRMNNIEGWMGRTGQHGDGAMVLMRRVLHFSVRHVWPGLHAALDERRPAAERSWVPWVRQEIQAALDEETYRLLSETAEDQQALIEVAAAIEAREACGSRFRVYSLPYNGLTPRSIQALRHALARSDGNTECPEVLVDEAARIVGASERLATTPGLSHAIERLAMVVARSVAAHELRHAADGDDNDAIPCPGCPDGLDGLARAEVSAYLSAMSTTGLGYLALFQACATPSGLGVQGAAKDAVIEALLPFGCEGPTLWGLYRLASELEAQLFGERQLVEVPEIPDRVELLARPARRPRLADRALQELSERSRSRSRSPGPEPGVAVEVGTVSATRLDMAPVRLR